jgi:hypothetical protein
MEEMKGSTTGAKVGKRANAMIPFLLQCDKISSSSEFPRRSDMKSESMQGTRH